MQLIALLLPAVVVGDCSLSSTANGHRVVLDYNWWGGDVLPVSSTAATDPVACAAFCTGKSGVDTYQFGIPGNACYCKSHTAASDVRNIGGWKTAPVPGFSLGRIPTGATVTVICNAGYSASSSTAVSCLATGQWSAVLPVCNSNTPIACALPYTPNGYRTIESYNWYGGAEGTNPSNAAVHTANPAGCHTYCSQFGTQNIDSYQFAVNGWCYCKRWATVDRIDSLPGSPWRTGPLSGQTIGNVPPGAVASITCSAGYVANAGSVTCQANGQWSSPLPICLPLGCALPSTPNGYRTVDGFNWFGGAAGTNPSNAAASIGSAAGCATYCTGQNVDTYQFSVGGWCYCKQWATVDRIDAGGAWKTGPLSGQTIGNVPVNAVASVACNSGYTASGGSVTCQSNFQWSGPLPTCTGPTNPPPPPPSPTCVLPSTPNGYRTIDNFNWFGGAAGTNPSNAAASTSSPAGCAAYCTGQNVDTYQFSLGGWCHCKQSATVDHVDPSGGWRTGPLPGQSTANVPVGVTASITCDTGYYASTGSATCLPTGQWSGTLPVCIPLGCSLASTPNGYRIVDGFNWYGGAAGPNPSNAAANTGSAAGCAAYCTGQNVDTYQFSVGGWCYCKQWAAVEHIDAGGAWKTGPLSGRTIGNVPVGAVASITCASGYTPSGGSVTCQSTLQWSSPLPTCLANGCSVSNGGCSASQTCTPIDQNGGVSCSGCALSNTPNGFITVQDHNWLGNAALSSSNAAVNTATPAACSAFCSSNAAADMYQFAVDGTCYCKKWFDASSVQLVPGSMWQTGALGATTIRNVPAGAVATIVCNPGYSARGWLPTCMASGAWNYALPTCSDGCSITANSINLWYIKDYNYAGGDVGTNSYGTAEACRSYCGTKGADLFQYSLGGACYCKRARDVTSITYVADSFWTTGPVVGRTMPYVPPGVTVFRPCPVGQLGGQMVCSTDGSGTWTGSGTCFY